MASTWDEAIDAFINSLRAAGRTEGTLRVRTHYARQIARLAPTPADLTTGHIEGWLAGAHWSAETRRNARTTARMLCTWLELHDHIDKSPARDLLPVRLPRPVPRPAPDLVFKRAMEAAPYRTRVMLALARHLGLRCVEIAQIHTRDLAGDVLIVRGKGGHERRVPVLHPELRAAIIAAGGWLFPSKRDRTQHVSAEWVSKLIARALPDHWTAHTLRHAFATTSYTRYPDLLALAEVLGHVKVETTRRYAGIPEAALRKVVESGAPAMPARKVTNHRWDRAAWPSQRHAA